MRNWILTGALAAAALACGVLWQRAEAERQVMAEKVRALEAAARVVPQRQATPVPVEPEDAVVEPGKQGTVAPARTPSSTVNVGDYLKTIEDLRAQTVELRKQVSAAREEATKAGERSAELAAHDEKLAAQIKDLQEDVQLARRTAEALESELKAKNSRILRVEAAEKLAQERLAKAEAGLAQAGKSGTELEDINRRREVYLNNLLRRFREVTDLYRTLSLDLQNREQTAAGTQAGDLSRIQNSIQQAEDDLRQLQNLNGRAARLTQKK